MIQLSWGNDRVEKAHLRSTGQDCLESTPYTGWTQQGDNFAYVERSQCTYGCKPRVVAVGPGGEAFRRYDLKPPSVGTKVEPVVDSSV